VKVTSIGKTILSSSAIVAFVLFGLLLAIAFQFSFVFEAATEAYLGENNFLLNSRLLEALFTPVSSSITALATAGLAVFAFYSNNRRNWLIVLLTVSIAIACLLSYIAYLYLAITKLI